MRRYTMGKRSNIYIFSSGESVPRIEDPKSWIKYNNQIEKFKNQLNKAHAFREKRYSCGLPLHKIGYLYELEHMQPLEGITQAYDLGYMMGYQAAKREHAKNK